MALSVDWKRLWRTQAVSPCFQLWCSSVLQGPAGEAQHRSCSGLVAMSRVSYRCDCMRAQRQMQGHIPDKARKNFKDDCTATRRAVALSFQKRKQFSTDELCTARRGHRVGCGNNNHTTHTTHIPVMVKTGRLTGMIIHGDMSASRRSPLQSNDTTAASLQTRQKQDAERRNVSVIRGSK